MHVSCGYGGVPADSAARPHQDICMCGLCLASGEQATNSCVDTSPIIDLHGLRCADVCCEENL